MNATAPAPQTTPRKTFTAPLKVFISYAHEDDAERERLLRHLMALVDGGLVLVRDERRITAGSDWAAEIASALGAADIVLLLVSADFLASDYCKGVELKAAIELHDAGQARVVPVIVRSCDWAHSAFARFNALPPDRHPVAEAEHPDQACKAVAAGLRALADELLAPPGAGTAPALGSDPPPAPGRTLRIAKVSILGVEFGGFDLRLPTPGRRVVLGALLLLLLAAAAAGWWLLSEPLAEAQDWARMARYDLAQQALDRVPDALRAWPNFQRARATAALGVRTFDEKPDWQALARDLRVLRSRWPRDPVLLVIEAAAMQQGGRYDEALSAAKEAAEADPRHAEARFMQGLVADVARGDLEGALGHYVEAARLAPESPQYANNVARASLDLGRYKEAVAAYRQIRDYPLARVELALAHWALGEPVLAADAQRQALALLADPKHETPLNNRREWTFLVPTQQTGYALGRADRRCYAALGLAVSNRLAGDGKPLELPPSDCPQPTQAVRAIVAEDLCRFVALPQPSLAPAVATLRRELGFDTPCPAPPATSPPAKT